MTPLELIKSILLLAFKGKLVNQNKEEVSFDLLSDILKHGFANKKYLSFTNELAPYDIPENWSWCMFHDVVTLENGKKEKGVKLPYLEAKYLRGNAEAKYLESGEIVEPGTKVILVDGENSGEVFFVKEKGYMGSTFKVLNICNFLDEKYVLYFMKLHQDDYRNNKKGAAIPHLNKNVFFEMPFPLPPFEEQKRIVAKIEELLPLADRYEEAWNKLEKFNKKFPSDMENSLLQFAFSGKLVEQKESEGTGKQLLSTFKNKKKVLAFDDDEFPFEIPQSWTWVHLNEISDSMLGKTINKSLDTGEETKYLCSINVYWEGIDLLTVKSTKFSRDEKDKYLLKQGDLLICEGGDVGRSALWESEEEMYYQNALHRVRFYSNIVPRFYLYVLKLYKANLMIKKHSKGETIKHLVQGELNSMPFPLPPYNEQKRIVAKLEELLPLCRKLVK